VNLFPTRPIRIGSLASAKLCSVRHHRDFVVGRFALEPEDEVAFIDRVAVLEGASLGRRYAPLVGTWGTYEIPKGSEEVELVVGVYRPFGCAMAKAYRDLRLDPPSVISDLVIRTLALGYLARAGV